MDETQAKYLEEHPEEEKDEFVLALKKEFPGEVVFKRISYTGRREFGIGKHADGLAKVSVEIPGMNRTKIRILRARNVSQPVKNLSNLPVVIETINSMLGIQDVADRLDKKREEWFLKASELAKTDPRLTKFHPHCLHFGRGHGGRIELSSKCAGGILTELQDSLEVHDVRVTLSRLPLEEFDALTEFIKTLPTIKAEMDADSKYADEVLAKHTKKEGP